jgi:hypothetical protein
MRTSNFALRLQPSLLAEARRTAEEFTPLEPAAGNERNESEQENPARVPKDRSIGAERFLSFTAHIVCAFSAHLRVAAWASDQ